MTSDGPYPPGYEPAPGGPPYGRYPGDEQAPDAPAGRSSASARVSPPGPWGTPANPDQYGVDQTGREQPGGPPSGFGAVPGQYRASAPPSGVYGAPAEPTQYGRPAQPSEPTQYGGGGQGQYGEPTQYGRPTEPTQYGGGAGQYAEPTQYGGGAGQYGDPTQYGRPSQPSEPTQYGGAGQYGEPSQYGTPTQYGSGGQGQYGTATQYGTPTQYGGGQGQYGTPTQYGSGQGQGQYDDPEAERFGPAYGDQPPSGDGEPGSGRRRVLIIGGAIAGIVVIALIAVAVLVKSGGGGTKTSDFAVGACVKQSGSKAAKATCAETGAYSIVSKVDSEAKCPDPKQPFVILHRSGSADQVLCLKPAS